MASTNGTRYEIRRSNSAPSSVLSLGSCKAGKASLAIQAQCLRTMHCLPITFATLAFASALFLFLPPLATATATPSRAPLALHQLIQLKDTGSGNVGIPSIDNDVVVDLTGYNYNDHDTAAIIVTLPTDGQLFQLSQIYSSHGYDPKTGSLIEPTDLPFLVPSKDKSRVVYRASSTNHIDSGRRDEFEYTVSDISGTSKAGKITFVDDSNILVASEFLFDSDGWTTVGNKKNAVVHEGTSMGSRLNRFIYAQDDLLNINEEGNDVDLWRFSLPDKFLGWQGAAYGGSLIFALGSFVGDFEGVSNLNNGGDLNLVEISCERCAFNRGITIGFPLSEFSGATTQYTLPLEETAGWVKDPGNPLHEWSEAPSQCEMIEVLSRISSITIAGDFTKFHETVIIDNVHLSSAEPMGRFHLPVCAQEDPVARTCSCGK